MGDEEEEEGRESTGESNYDVEEGDGSEEGEDGGNYDAEEDDDDSSDIIMIEETNVGTGK